MAPPAQDALKGLSDLLVRDEQAIKESRSAGAQSAAILEWLRRRLEHMSVLVKHKTLVTLKVLLENGKRFVVTKLRENEGAMLELEALKTYEPSAAEAAAMDSKLGNKPVLMIREESSAVMTLTKLTVAQRIRRSSSGNNLGLMGRSQDRELEGAGNGGGGSGSDASEAVSGANSESALPKRQRRRSISLSGGSRDPAHAAGEEAIIAGSLVVGEAPPATPLNSDV